MTIPSLTDALRAQQDRLSHCVHCGFCLPVCPTYIQLGDEADSPRGRLHLMQAVVEDRLDPASDAFQTHLDRCLGCRACETVCPSGVEYGFLLERARALTAEARRPPLLSRLLPEVMANSLLRRIALASGRVLRRTGIPHALSARLPTGGVLGRARLAMGMLATSRPVRPGRWSPRSDLARSEIARSDLARSDIKGATDPNSPASAPLSPGIRGRVALLTGCVQSGLFEHVNRATRQVLEVNGWEVVEVADQGCCGALHAHSGDLDGARALAEANVEAFHSAGVDHVVSNAAGCGALLKEMGELLEDTTARSVSEGTRDIAELLASEGVGPVTGSALPLRVAYDPPCHLHHAQRVAEAPVRLLSGIPGVELVPIPGAEECCGGAGIYGITHQDLGGRIGRRKVDAILSTGCDVVATGNPGCQMQIGAGLAGRGHTAEGRERVIPVLHPVELLAESYRRAGWV